MAMVMVIVVGLGPHSKTISCVTKWNPSPQSRLELHDCTTPSLPSNDASGDTTQYFSSLKSVFASQWSTRSANPLRNVASTGRCELQFIQYDHNAQSTQRTSWTMVLIQRTDSAIIVGCLFASSSFWGCVAHSIMRQDALSTSGLFHISDTQPFQWFHQGLEHIAAVSRESIHWFSNMAWHKYLVHQSSPGKLNLCLLALTEALSTWTYDKNVKPSSYYPAKERQAYFISGEHRWNPRRLRIEPTISITSWCHRWRWFEDTLISPSSTRIFDPKFQ